MPPTLKMWGAYCFGHVHVCMHPLVQAIVLKLHVWIPHGKIADPYFFPNYLPLMKYAPFGSQISLKVLQLEVSNLTRDDV